MAFERFDKREAVAVNKGEEVTVQTNGLISLTWKAYEMIGEPEAIEFIYDRANGVVGLLPTDRANPNAYAIRRPNDGAKGKVSVRGTALFKYYDVSLAKQFKAEPFVEDGALCFKVGGTKSQRPAEPSANPWATATSDRPPFASEEPPF